jgi:hypothetical protein
MRHPIESGRFVHPKAEATRTAGEYPGFRMLARPSKIDERARLREPANDANRAAPCPHRNAARMFSAGRDVRQHSSGFSVVALLANLWRPF